MNSTAENAAKFGIAASRRWWQDARELAVSFDRYLEDQIVAWVKLNCRDEISQTAPSIEFYYSLISKAFLMMYDNEIINPIFPITDLGQSFIDQARRATGIGVQSSPALEPVLSPTQVLENTVRSDWKNLPSKQIRQKINNDRTYRECFERLAGELESAVTTRVVIGD